MSYINNFIYIKFIIEKRSLFEHDRCYKPSSSWQLEGIGIFTMAGKRLVLSLAGVHYHASTSPYCKNLISIIFRCPFVTLLTP